MRKSDEMTIGKTHPRLCLGDPVNLSKTIIQAVQMIENNLVLIDEDQPDLFEKKLIQLNASFINQLVMNPLLNGVNLKSGTALNSFYS